MTNNSEINPTENTRKKTQYLVTMKKVVRTGPEGGTPKYQCMIIFLIFLHPITMIC
jgi:hypothetical protein